MTRLAQLRHNILQELCIKLRDKITRIRANTKIKRVIINDLTFTLCPTLSFSNDSNVSLLINCCDYAGVS